MPEQNNAWKITGIVNGAIALCIVAAFLYTRKDVPDREDGTLSPNGTSPTNQSPITQENETTTAAESPTNAQKAEDDSTYSFSGKVMDQRIHPMPGVSVMLVGEMEHSTLTDEEGEFRFSKVSRGKYEVQLKKWYWGDHAETVKISADLEKNFTFLHHLTFRGKIVDANTGGSVVRFNWDVFSSKNEQLSFGKKSDFDIENSEGRFEFPAPEDVRMDFIRVGATGYIAKRIPIIELAPDSENLIVLEPDSSSHEGIVYAPNGDPISSAFIFSETFDTSDNAKNKAFATTDPNGRFRFQLPEGDANESILLFADHDNYAPTMYSVLPDEMPRGPIEITLRDAGELRIHVTSDGEDLSNHSVKTVYPGDFLMGEWKSETNAEGLARVTGLPPGRVVVTSNYPYRLVSDDVRGLGGTDVVVGNFRSVGRGPTIKHRTEVEIRAGEISEIQLDLVQLTATLEGVVARGGQPIEGGYVQLSVRAEHGDSFYSTSVRKDGYFQFEHALPGNAKVTYYKEEPHSMFIRTFDTTLAAGTTTHLNLEMAEPNASLSLQSSDEEPDAAVLAIVYQGIKHSYDDSVFGLFGLRFSGLNPDLRFMVETEKNKGMSLQNMKLEPGDYTVFIVKSQRLFGFNNDPQYIVEHITLSENEERLLEYQWN
jgi:hypothetical protein